MAGITIQMLAKEDYADPADMNEAANYESDGTFALIGTCSAIHGGTITGYTGGLRLLIAPPAWISTACAPGDPTPVDTSAMPLLAWLLYRFYAVQQHEVTADAPTRISRKFKMIGDTSEVWYTVKIKIDDFGDFPARLGAPIDDLA